MLGITLILFSDNQALIDVMMTGTANGLVGSFTRWGGAFRARLSGATARQQLVGAATNEARKYWATTP